jgi:4,5-dihydroxyphthalate decarboxylase
MARLTISLAGVDYDRTRALFSGEVGVDGCRVIPLAMSPEEAFHRAIRFQEFDVSELSLSSYLIATTRGTSAYAAIPVFPARMFRHSAIYVRSDRGIAAPADLRGKRIGVPEYQMTVALWVRGILADEYGVSPAEIAWRTGGLQEPGRKEKIALTLPPGIDLQPIPADRTLDAMLDAGEIDGLVSAAAPACLATSPKVMRLFPDYPAVEADYYRRTRLFPIMHVVGIRRTLLDQHPWLAVNVYKAYLRAKAVCYEHLAGMGHLFTALPWPVRAFEEARALLGEDYWSYGLDGNLAEIETATRYAHEQGLTPRRLAADELFVPSTLSLARN